MEQNSEGKHDPGWNDPPLFTYERATAIQASVNKKGISLNKRIAYPMHTKVTSNSSTLDNTAPPLITSPPKTFTPSSVAPCNISAGGDCDSSNQVTANLSDSEKLDQVLKNLEKLIPVNDEEVNKRIKIMEKMWTDGKLDESVQLKLIELTEALCKEDTELADHIQIGLMVDHVSQCSSWMSGIRQLINNIKKC